MNKTLNKIKTILKELKNSYKGYFKTNILFFSFVIGAVLNATLVRFLTVQNFISLYPVIADLIVVLLIGSIGYFIKPKNRIKYFMLWAILLTTLCVINSMYYTFYTSFSSFSLLSTSVYVADVSDAVMQNVISWKDLTYVWFPIVLYIIHLSLKKKKYYKKIEELNNAKARAVNTLVIAGVLLCIFCATLTSVDIGRLNKQWNREYLVMRFGLYTYQVNDLVKSIEPKINSIFGYDNALKNYREFYENREVSGEDNEYTDIFEGKNIITIHAESIQQFNMELEFNGEPVTPVLNELASEGLYFSNFYTQVSVGTSSDTEFTLNTSLMPATNGTVFVSYWDREFVTIPKLLDEKGYYSFSMHGNNCDFWNRGTMHKEMGYDTFYCKQYYNIDETIGLGLSDKSFFRQSVSMIEEIQEREQSPFYGTMITLSNHTPFAQVEDYGEYPVSITIERETTEEERLEDPTLGNIIEEIKPYMEGTKLGNYFKSVHYADSAIGEFIVGLDEAGLLEDTVIVIYGDHDARLPKNDYRRLYNYDPITDDLLSKDDLNYVDVDYYNYELNRKVPFIIWSKDFEKPKEIIDVMGTYDILPTLGNMVGIESEYQLGHDMFNDDQKIVVFPNGNWLTNKVYYNSQKEEYFMLVEEPITQEYIDANNEYASSLLGVSNDIVVYDLIKKDQEQETIIEEFSQ